MDTIGMLTQNLDKTQLPPLHQKRVLAFVNHFLINSCGFLNDFALQCETKFIELERKLQKVEASLTIIEAKLASIPDVQNKSAQIAIICKDDDVPHEKLEEKNEVDSTLQELKECLNEIKVSEHDSYKKFFKMLHVGVPSHAIKIKMKTEGLDPSMLDNPNTMIPLEDSQKSSEES